MMSKSVMFLRSQKYLSQVRQSVVNVKGWSQNLRFVSTTHRNHGTHVDLSIKDNVGIIRLQSPGKVNVLGKDVAKEIETIFAEFESNPKIHCGVLISNKPGCFIAGADINLINSLETKEDTLQESKDCQLMLDRIANGKKPVVAAVMGSCLGGGLEVALACQYRMAVADKSTFAFPEVMLGLLPGAGGTQRLPKLIGVPDSLDMMLTGRTVRTDKARKLGLVDSLINTLGPGCSKSEDNTLNYLEEIAVKTAKDLADGRIKLSRKAKNTSQIVMNKLLKFDFAKDYVFNKAKKKVMDQTLGLYPAPLKILDVVRTGLDKGEKEGYKSEANGFAELVMSPQSKGLISVFHGQTECKKNKLKKPRNEVKSIGVLGAGLMGAGISQASAANGYTTLLKDTNEKALSKGLIQIEKGFSKMFKQKKISGVELERNNSRLISSIDYSGFGKADMIIEAVSEDINVKHKVLKEVENIIPEHCVFATNTSALPIAKIAEVSKRPEKVIGMHYFSPVDRMPLLEIIKTSQTSEDTISVAVEVGLKQGKVVVVVSDGPGFYTSRIIMALGTQAFNLIVEGFDPEKLDEASKKFGFPIGLASLMDEVGIDVANHAYQYMVSCFGERTITFDPQLGWDIEKAGLLGRKSGKGTYIYENGVKKGVNPEAMKILEQYKTEPKVPHTFENIQLMPVCRMINEAVMCLEEGIIDRPLDGDIAAIFGLGFPPFTGGPFHFVDSFGADKMVDKMREYEQGYGLVFTPCQTLLDHAKDKSKKFFKS